ncbi:dynein regulatory complex protein 1 homolog [Episyrphus balteatus]|uniref:dynein regulatory complex protein 1 homolog n=1 Tax=Episyrphus balteatus TaxID=286459 RepID=UPI0024853DA9|nr:dynein regulatory complex protein 1 homolog [Episyrphus balteatus]
MAEEKKKNTGFDAECDARRQKIRELIKDHIKVDNAGKIKQKKTGIEGQLESSDEKLKELIQFGDELVTNIKVAREMREIQRRSFEEAQKKALLNDLSKESSEAIAKFNSISDKWSELKSYKEPVVMFNQLENQKECIKELMISKDNIIDKCQKEINRVSDKYYTDQEKQSDEICLLVERIDCQVELIKKAYKNHLDLLQDAIEEERLAVAKTESEQWNGLFDTIKTFGTHKLQIEKDKEKIYVSEIEKNCREQQEITRDTRIRLERDAEALQLELRSTQNNVLMNSEKLDYNYQVLKKRNEENVIINNQQKRRLAKFKETITALKSKIQTITEKSHGVVKKMSVEVEKLYTNISHLEKKSQQFLQANEKKFSYVWNINYQEALSLTNRIFEIDRLLHVQQLGVEWTPHNIEGLLHCANINTGENIISVEVESKRNSSSTCGKTVTQQVAEIRLLRCILKKISDRAGFLIEDKLLKILEPYTDEEKRLVRLDNIFYALNITEYKDITSLIDFFLPYSWCPNCAYGLPSDNGEALRDYDERPNSTRGRPSLAVEIENVMATTPSSPSSVSDNWSISTDDIERNITSILTNKKECERPMAQNKEENICSRHYLVIKPAFVLTALRSFTENYLKKHDKARLGKFERAIVRSSTTNRSLTRDVKEKCWSTLLQTVTEENKKLWQTLEHGLDHYLDVLKEREELDVNCEFLRRQNTELRHLLQKHLPSAV